MEDIFINNKLDRKEQDDCILASIMEFVASHNSDKIIYVSNDVGSRLKAKGLGIEIFKLSDDYLLPLELDNSEKEIVQLNNELSKLKNRLPVLEVFFEPDFKVLTVERVERIADEEVVIKRAMEDITVKYPLLFQNPKINEMEISLTRLAADLALLSEAQIVEYNTELERFYLKYEKYIRLVYARAIFQHHCIKIKFVIKNSGTTPAEDIDIRFHFPDGFEIYDVDELPKVTKKPEPPYKPKNRLDYTSSLLASRFNSVVSPKLEINTVNFNLGKPTIKRSHSYDVDYHVRNLKHNQSVDLEILHVKYEDIQSAKGFTIDYKIMAANIPQILTGKLNVRFE